MTSEKRRPQEIIDLMSQLSPKQQSANQKEINRKIRAEVRLDIEKYHLKILEHRRQAIENLTGIVLERRLKLYDDFESVFKRLNNLMNEKFDPYDTDYCNKWESISNEYKSLLQREKLYTTIQTSGTVGDTDKPAETEQNTKKMIVAIIISLFVILLFEFLIYKIPFTWLKNHPNSYSLQGSIIFLVLSLLIGFFKPQWRNWCWGTAGFAFFVLIVSLLGGR